MIVEVRDYVTKPGARGRFLKFFEEQAKPLQQSLGIGVIGPFVDLERPDAFIWLRTFPSMEERGLMKDALYNGRAWKDELEAIAMPMIDRFDVALTTTAEPCVSSAMASRHECGR